jgi:hypothetical protein
MKNLIGSVPSRVRQEAEIARDFLDMFFNGVAWPCGPPMLMKNLDRNRAVTGRERLAHLDMFFNGAVSQPVFVAALCRPSPLLPLHPKCSNGYCSLPGPTQRLASGLLPCDECYKPVSFWHLFECVSWELIASRGHLIPSQLRREVNRREVFMGPYRAETGSETCAISSAVSRKSRAPITPFTCSAERMPTMAAVTSGRRRVHAMAASPVVRPWRAPI